MISLKSLTCGFTEAIVRAVELDFFAGEIIVFLGSNGAGKSCLLQTIGGVLSPLAGQVVGLSSDFSLRASQISYASQSPISATDMQVKTYLNLVSPVNNNDYDFICRELGVDKLRDKSLAKISGGERQRVRLAATLIQGSNIFLLDEPTNSLDPKPIQNLVEIIKYLKNEGKCFAVVTHDLTFALEIGTRFVGIRDQSILFNCSQNELRQQKFLDLLFERDFKWQSIEGEDKWLVY